MKPVVFHAEATQEFLEAITYYSNVSSQLAERFHSEIQDLIHEIQKSPQKFFRFDPPAQRARSHQFPYWVIYLEKTSRIQILAVMHTKRKPGYWKDRLR